MKTKQDTFSNTVITPMTVAGIESAIEMLQKSLESNETISKEYLIQD